MKDKIFKLMSTSEEGQKFTSKNLIKYLDLPEMNQSYKILAVLMGEFKDCFVKCQITYYENGNRHCVKGYKLYQNPYTVEDTVDVNTTIDITDTIEEEHYTINENTLKREILDTVALMKRLYFVNDIDDGYCLNCLEMAKYSFKNNYEQLQVLIQ